MSETSTSPAALEDLCRQMLVEMLTLMGHTLQVETRIEEDRIVASITGEGSSELIGRRGQTLDALQFILNRMLNRTAPDRRPVVVDSGGYRQRRIEALKDLAQQLGDKVRRSGKAVAVNPMSAHDRRVIHMTLREVPGLSTRSEGDGEERRILIVPASD